MLFLITQVKSLHPFSYPICAVKLDALIANNKIEEAQTFYNKISFLFNEIQKLNYETALKSLQKKDWSEAIRLLKEELEKEPNNPLFHEELGWYYIDIMKTVDVKINGKKIRAAYDRAGDRKKVSLYLSEKYSTNFLFCKLSSLDRLNLSFSVGVYLDLL